MKAITLIQPWASAIAKMDKRIENRTWKYPGQLKWQRIAIHAGKKVDKGEFEALFGITGVNKFNATNVPFGAIIATARLGHIREWPDEDNDKPDRWFFGPYGWELSHVRPLSPPVPFNGKLGIWSVPDYIVAQVIANEIRQEEGPLAALKMEWVHLHDIGYRIYDGQGNYFDIKTPRTQALEEGLDRFCYAAERSAMAAFEMPRPGEDIVIPAQTLDFFKD